MQRSKKLLLCPLIALFAFFWIPRLAFILNNKAPIFDHLRMKDLFLSVAFDLSVMAYALLPFCVLLLLALIPKTRWIVQKIAVGFGFITVFFVFFSCFAEIFFIDEFSSRFNFIAVDYLVYTNEVLKNVFESYPVGWIVLGLFVLILPIFYWGFLPSIKFIFSGTRRLATFIAVVFVVAVSSFFLLDEGRVLSGNSAFFEEVSKNTMSTFVHAYLNNEINYFKFYKSVEPEQAVSFVYEDLKRLDNHVSTDPASEDSNSVLRNFHKDGAGNRMNVVLIIMESLSAKFLNHYGSTLNITPNLDRLIGEGAWFSQIHATGTRTVRGIEALLIGIPPTPGQSIVRRELGGKIFELGSVFRKNNYHLNFIYGGHSYFDNMKSFFSDHSYQIHDEGTFPENEITFSNAWGVSDEDLFDQSIKISNQQKEKPFFNVILTTSNHRPYTYPENKIDIPSKSGREGAVKYSDYAIGEYLKKAAKQPWFDKTIFIFAADHNASVSGGETLDPKDYLVPVIFYAPKLIKPQRLDGIASLIDIPSTILSSLNMSYHSKFWGTDLWNKRPDRAFIATYQKIGFIDSKQQVTLAPKEYIEVRNWADDSERQVFNGGDEALKIPMALKAISYYTAASYLYSHKMLQEDSPATDKNIRK